jgi:hypothetical protein
MRARDQTIHKYNKETISEEVDLRIIRAMARKGVGTKGKQSESSSSKGPTTCSRAARIAWTAKMHFKHLITEKERHHYVGIEEVVK